MASFRKSGKGWRAEVFKHGQRESVTFPTKREAQEWANKREGELSARRNGRVIRWTLSKVLNRYVEEITSGKAGSIKETIRTRAFQRNALSGSAMCGCLRSIH